MKDIIEPVDTDDGLFHDGDPSTGAEGTIVYAKIMNALQGGLISTQSEIKTILTAAGVKPDGNAVDQLFNALNKLFASADNELIKNALQKNKNLSDLSDAAKARQNLGVGSIATHGEGDFVPTAGGIVGYLDNADHYATKDGAWPGAGAFANQLTDRRALFYSAGAMARGNTYWPLIKGSMQTVDIGYLAAVSFGILVPGNAQFPSACIHIIGDSGKSNIWSFDPNAGGFTSPGRVYSGEHVIAAHGVYESGGNVRVYSPNNPPDMSAYVSGMMRGAPVSPGKINEYGPDEAPAGCVLTRAWHDPTTSYGVLFTYRPLQIYINGAWRTITG